MSRTDFIVRSPHSKYSKRSSMGEGGGAEAGERGRYYVRRAICLLVVGDLELRSVAEHPPKTYMPQNPTESLSTHLCRFWAIVDTFVPI